MQHTEQTGNAIATAATATATTSAAALGLLDYWAFFVGAISFAMSCYMFYDTIKYRREQRERQRLDDLAKEAARQPINDSHIVTSINKKSERPDTSKMG